MFKRVIAIKSECFRRGSSKYIRAKSATAQEYDKEARQIFALLLPHESYA